jgi:hypothetical protein
VPLVGALSFANPWALAALALVPVLWWLLRVTPPAPRRLRFPPVRLLGGLGRREETAAASPWWLVLLRLLLVTAVILAVAHPLLDAGSALRGRGPLVLVVDDGWAAARDWPARQTMMADLVDRAARRNRPVMVITTAATATPRHPALQDAAAARALVEGLRPKPWDVERVRSLRSLTEPGALAIDPPGHVAWLSDGLERGDTDAFVRSLRRFGAVTVVAEAPQDLASILHLPVFDGDTLEATVARAEGGHAREAWVQALAEDGRLLDRAPVHFADGESQATARLELPAELRNRLARLGVEGESTAAAVVLVDERWRRRPVGLVSGEGTAGAQPLLGDLYYLERALTPFTEVRRGTVTGLLGRRLAVLVLADPGPLEAGERQSLERWIEAGGVAVRFAGPRLAQNATGPLPVQLRQGDRVMGGAMSWRQPATLAIFDENSPFHGLDIPPDVRVRRQVLARPSLDLADRTWARLSDGTPLVSAEKRGTGWLVLVHTTANTAWSDLPLSGLFVRMLRRLVALSQGVVGKTDATPLPPLETLDAFGHLGPPPAHARPVQGAAMSEIVPGPEHPPGYYGDDTARRALNLSASLDDPAPLGRLPSGVARLPYGKARAIDLRPWLLVAALLFAVIDLGAALALRRLLRLAGIAGTMLVAADAGAQSPDSFALAASLNTRLAYVLSGDAETDEISRAGLTGLGVVVNRRTAAELGAPVAVDPEVDDLAFFPLLYWPMTDSRPPPSPTATAHLNTYLRNGGTILFDTRQQGGGAPWAALRAIGNGLDIPPLVRVPRDHVLGRAYYLLAEFPGRWTGGDVWVERVGERVNDGVSPVIVGAHDWAAAWAMDDARQPLFAVIPGGERQREMAYRFGINLVMYALTGNYKSDQVHMPTILQRLGQ